jgi:hypothetical protein
MCACPSYQYKRAPKICKHVREFARQQAVALTAAELAHARADEAPIDEFPDALLSPEVPPDLDAIQHTDGEKASTDVDVPPLDVEATGANDVPPAAVDPRPVAPEQTGPQAALLAALDQDLDEIRERLDRRLERVTARLAGGASDPAAPAPSVMAKYRAAREQIAREKHNAA